MLTHLTHAVFSASFGLEDEIRGDRNGAPREDITAWLAALVGSVHDVAGQRCRVVDLRSVSVHQAPDPYLLVFAHAVVSPLDPVLWEPTESAGDAAPPPPPATNLKVVAYAADGSRIAVSVDAGDFPNGGPHVRNLMERQALTDVLRSAHGSALRLAALTCHWDGDWPGASEVAARLQAVLPPAADASDPADGARDHK
jgi:hypothetical protein